MTSRFRGELTVVPPVRMFIRKTGVRTAIDWSTHGADRALSGTRFQLLGDFGRAGPLPTDRFLIPGTRVDFGGGDVAAMTSSGLSQFKELLIATYMREREIRADIKKAKLQHAISWTARALSWGTLLSVVSKSLRAKADRAVALRKAQVSTLGGNLAASRISISFDMETAVADPHRHMLQAFDQLAISEGSWALKTSQHIDRVKARSMSSTVVDRIVARLARRTDPLVDTADLPLSLPVQNGRSTAYFYPGFVLVVDVDRSNFAIIDLKELDISYTSVRFTESERVPTDARLVGKVWAKSNKDGSRDRRFKDNRELPVMLYGELGLKTSTGLNEAFMFSRSEPCEAFVRAIGELKRVLATGAVPLSAGSKSLPK
ncbi:hypothetical protein [Sphingomonas pokkalii]|nr:hypothetical protein [Sphingomonas pokkalii]